MESRSLTHNDYTVGLVCALPKEQTAAIAMLDERHDDLPNPVNDPNAYTLGSMSNHNVVIACLPKGEIGTSSAATVSTRLISTFPSIRFGLMVGIGGGVPQKVRLGDVVVSTPTDGLPGVIQWDMGKAEQGDTFKQTGVLNNPPSALLTALTRLESKHDMEGSSIPQYLGDMMAKYPRLAAKYARGDHLEDICFEADYNHVTAASDRQSCSNVGRKRDHGGRVFDQDWNDCQGCDRTRTLKRQSRDMVIHHGLIASGNQVIKDAKFRDRINARLGGHVLCFEMEAAGLMNNFPCAVVRGICDYCDTHKNKQWQEYAATVAAAFAKELLSVITPARVAETPTAVKVMQTVSDTVNRIRDDVHNIRENLNTLNRTEEDQYRKALRCWLSTIDYEPIQSDIYRNHQDGTGQWFLNHISFRSWMFGDSSPTLFCPGIPGAGKTTITSMVVSHLRAEISHKLGQHRKVGIAFLYCSYERQDNQSCEDLLRSLLSQLTLEQEVLPPRIRHLYDWHHQGRGRPSKQEIVKELHSAVNDYSTVFVLIDALDECKDDTTRRSLLAEMAQLQQTSDIRLMLTSRPSISMNHNNAIELPIQAMDQDVHQYLTAQLGCLSRIVERDELLQQEIQTRISQAANGNFLLAHLYMGSLQGKHTKKAIHQELNQMGTGHAGLIQAYNAALQRVKNGLSKNLLSWVICAKRLLTVNELLHALAIEPRTSRLDTANICDIQEVVSGCAGLVVLHGLTQNVRLVHNTAKEYFQQDASKHFPGAETQIAISCLTYLSFDAFKAGMCSRGALETRLQEYPLFSYASQHWAHHAEMQTDDIKEVAMPFLLDANLVSAACDLLWISGFDSRPEREGGLPKTLSGIHLAAYFGLDQLVLELSSHVPPDATDNHERTALIYAAVRGHLLTVACLIDSGADVNSRDFYGGTALHYAALKGQDDVVAFLIKIGADINSRDYYLGTPLTWAIEGQSEATMKTILKKRPKTEILYAPLARYPVRHLPVEIRRLYGNEPILKSI
ncbi:hypothetical protein BDV06DRAFT_221659 [Aspergillus oleicola]